MDQTTYKGEKMNYTNFIKLQNKNELYGSGLKIGLYARVSTKDKDQNPENQLMKLKEFCKNKGWDYKEYVDYASGKDPNRPELKKMMQDLENDEIAGILVLRLDRFGRSVSNILENIKKIKDKGKFFIAIDQGISINYEGNQAMNDFLITILSAVAEFERNLISERVKDGIERAKKQGIKIGRKSVLEKKGISIQDLKKLREQGYSYRQIAIRTGIKFSTIYKILNQDTELNKLNNK